MSKLNRIVRKIHGGAAYLVAKRGKLRGIYHRLDGPAYEDHEWLSWDICGKAVKRKVKNSYGNS